MSRGKKFKPYNLDKIEGIKNDFGITSEEILGVLVKENITLTYYSRGTLSTRIELHPMYREKVLGVIGKPISTEKGASLHEGIIDIYEAEYVIHPHHRALHPEPGLEELAQSLGIKGYSLKRITYLSYKNVQRRR